VETLRLEFIEARDSFEEDTDSWAVWNVAAESLARLLDAAPDIGIQTEDMCPNCVTPWKCNGPHAFPPTSFGSQWDKAGPDDPANRVTRRSVAPEQDDRDPNAVPPTDGEPR